MGNKKTNSQTVTKAYKLKAKIGTADIMKDWMPAIDEYSKYYNKLSNWICANLTTRTIGEMIDLYNVDKSKPYCQYFLDEQKRNLPFYMLFLDNYGQGIDNLLFEIVRNANPEGYNHEKDNIFGISDTYYRRFGYVKCVASNYKSKLSTIRTKIKNHKIEIGSIPTDDVLLEQTAYEVIKNDYKKDEEWKRDIEYQHCKAEKNQTLIYRLETLFAFWQKNKQSVLEYINKQRVETLSEFGGCKRKDTNLSMCLNFAENNIKITPIGLSRYEIRFGKSSLTLLGHRSLSKSNITKFGVSVTFQIKKLRDNRYEMYAIITSDSDYTKQTREPKNTVGVDVNIKHMLLSTSIRKSTKDLVGYVNLYDEFMKNEDFVKSCNDKERDMYRKIAEHPTFGVLEVESLFSRYLIRRYRNDSSRFNKVCDRNTSKREAAIRTVFEQLEKKYKDDHKIMFYLCSVQKMRAQYQAYFILKETYYTLQQEYDNRMGSASQTNPFINTDEAKEILVKLNNVLQKLIGCRDNIVTYAFNVIRENGYDTIALEYLNSSQFEKHYSLPTETSLLKYHKLEGKNISVWNSNYTKLHNVYEPILDDNGNITKFSLKDKGCELMAKDSFYNLIIKAVHFADIKDKFAQLSNNTDIQTAFVPSAFTSQMNSINHKVYCVKKMSSKGKMEDTLVNKRYVRRGQEDHINGLNADYNAACNIEYFVTNEDLRKMFTIQNNDKKCFNAPNFMVKKNYKKGMGASVIKALRSTDHIYELSDAEYQQLQDDYKKMMSSK